MHNIFEALDDPNNRFEVHLKVLRGRPLFRVIKNFKYAKVILMLIRDVRYIVADMLSCMVIILVRDVRYVGYRWLGVYLFFNTDVVVT